MTTKMVQPDVTEVLARFAATVKYDEIPDSVREFCKDLLLDALACALAGYRGEETNQVAAFASALAQSKESSIIGGGHLSLAGATLLNSYLITAVTMCDIHRSTAMHLSPVIFPPALGIAERDSLSGSDLLVALVVGCETATRIGIGLDYPAFRARGFHSPGTIGPFGTAAAVGRLIGFDSDMMATAFGLAGSQSAGTFAAWGTPTVKFHQCRGALSGLMAALLAQQGFVAVRHFLTAPDGGLYNSYSNGGCPEAVIEDLGKRWELKQISLRLWPFASNLQGLIVAMLEIVKKHNLKPDNTLKVRIFMGKTAFDMHGTLPAYKGKFEAFLSANYGVSAVLHDGQLSLTQFEPERYNDPALVRFAADKVEVAYDPALVALQIRVEAKTTDGKTIIAQCSDPKGTPENPASRTDVEGKFRTYARGRLSDSRIEEVIGIIAQLEKLHSVRTLMEILRVPL